MLFLLLKYGYVSIILKYVYLIKVSTNCHKLGVF